MLNHTFDNTCNTSYFTNQIDIMYHSLETSIIQNTLNKGENCTKTKPHLQDPTITRLSNAP